MQVENPFMIPRSEADAIARALGLSYAPEKLNAPLVTRAPASERSRATRMTIFGVVLVLAVQVWIISAGLVTSWPQYSCYYSKLAEAFEHRQTSLLTHPNPRHLALPDPYDPRANVQFRRYYGVHDLVLFEGKFYQYWGPVPALMLVPLLLINHGQTIGDQFLVFAFVAGTIALTGLLLRRLWGRFFSDQPAWTLFAGVVVAGLATPMSYLLARSAVYEAAIMGGQFFLMAGLCFLFCDGRAAKGERGEASKPWMPGTVRLLLAGCCWALAVGSRVSLAVAVTVLAAMTVGWIVRVAWMERRRQSAVMSVDNEATRFPALSRYSGGGWEGAVSALAILENAPSLPSPGVPGEGVIRDNRPLFPKSLSRLKLRRDDDRSQSGGVLKRCGLRLVALGLPLVIGAAALASYNQARFGTWLEFGQRFQLTGSNYHAMPNLFAASHVLPSLYSYALRPIRIEREFPFIEAAPGDNTFPSFIPLPANYEFNEPIAGLLGVTPFIWLVVIPVVILATNTVRRLRPAPKPLLAPLHNRRMPSAEERELDRVVLYLLAAATLGFAPVLFAIGSTMRYLADLTPCLMPLAVIGLWQYGRRVAGKPGLRPIFLTVAVLLAAYSVVVGMLLGITGYGFHFRLFNPHWFASVSQHAARWLGP